MQNLEKVDGEGKDARDINVPDPLDVHSIMGQNKIPGKTNAYPPELDCPLAGCY